MWVGKSSIETASGEIATRRGWAAGRARVALPAPSAAHRLRRARTLQDFLWRYGQEYQAMVGPTELINQNEVQGVNQ